MVDPNAPNAAAGGHEREPRPEEEAESRPERPSAKDGAEAAVEDGFDAELQALEADLEPVLGRRGPVGPGAPGDPGGSADDDGPHAWRDPRPGSPAAARPSFRASLRASFVSGRFEGDGAPPAHVDRALGAWDVPPANADAKARIRSAFLGASDGAAVSPSTAAAESADVDESEAAAAAHVSARSRRPNRDRSTGVGPSASRASAGRARRQAPAKNSRGLWIAASAVAALAAVFLALVTLRGDGGPGWTLGGESYSADVAHLVLDEVRVDGSPVDDLESLFEGLAGGATVTTGADSLRLVFEDEFVLEIGAESEVLLPELGGPGALEIRTRRGAVRVATAAAFRAAERELVVSSAHVRTVVRGTIFGLDVGEDYSCICCLEGEVAAEMLVGDFEPCQVSAGRTRLVMASAESHEMSLVAHHTGPLEALAEFW